MIFGQSRLTNERRARRRKPINDPDLIRIENRTKLLKLHFWLREKNENLKNRENNANKKLEKLKRDEVKIFLTNFISSNYS